MIKYFLFDNNFDMKKSIAICLLFLLMSSLLFSGCTHEMVSLYIYKMPNKLVYEIGEELDLTGLQLKNIKTDSALLKIYNDKVKYSGFDSQTSGKKEITVTYGNFTTSFSIFVANKVVNSSEELKNTINTADDGDIILIKKGEYNLDYLEINNKDLVIGGEGKDNTIINSFIIIGGEYNQTGITYSNLSENITIIGLTLTNSSEIKNNIVEFKNEYYNENLAGMNADSVKGLKVIACKLTGFTTGIKIANADNCYFSGNLLNKLFVGGIEITNSITNSTISKNIITEIGKSVVFANSRGEQSNIFGIKLGINKEENVGISIYKNSISKIAIKDNTTTIYLKEKVSGNYSSFNYMNNSAGIILFSTIKNNLQSNGISIFFNSIGSTLNNILYGTNKNDNINSSSVMYMSL